MSGKSSNKFAIYIAIGKISAMLAHFVMPLFLTRFLTKSDYGLYSQFFLVVTFLSSIFCFGLQSNLYYYYSKYSDKSERKKIVYNTLLGLFVFGFVGVLLLFIPHVGTYLIGNDNLYKYFYLILINIYLCIPSMILLPLATVEKDRLTTILFPPLDIILKVLLVVPIALYYETIESIFIAVLMLHIIELLFVISYVFFLFRKTEGSFFDLDFARGQIIYAFPFGIAVLLNTICQRVDKLMCVSFLSSEDYAVYSVAFFGIPGIMQIYDSLCQVNVVNMSTAFHDGRSDQIVPLYKDFLVRTLSFSVPLIFIVFLFAPQIVTFLFTEKYIESTPYFRLYIISFIFAMFGAGTILRSIGKTKLSMNAFFYATFLCLPLTYFLVRNYNIWGAMFSALFNTIIPKIFQIYYEVKETHYSICSFFPYKKIFMIFICSFLVLLPFGILQLVTTLSFYIVVILSIIYIIIVYCLEIKNDIFLISSSQIKNFYKKKFQ